RRLNHDDPPAVPVGHPRARVLVLAMLLVARATSSMAKELDGFGDARLRMSAEAVKRLFPALEPAGGIPPAGITYHRLQNQRFSDLENCALRFNFFRDELYE